MSSNIKEIARLLKGTLPFSIVGSSTNNEFATLISHENASDVDPNRGIGRTQLVGSVGGSDYILTLQNNTTTPYTMIIKDASGSDAGYPLFNVTDSTGSSTYLRVDSNNGRVGIGTQTMNQQLNVEGAIYTSIPNNGGSNYLYIAASDSNTANNDVPGIQLQPNDYDPTASSAERNRTLISRTFVGHATVPNQFRIVHEVTGDAKANLTIDGDGEFYMYNSVATAASRLYVGDYQSRFVLLQSPSSLADNGRVGTATNHDFEINAGNGGGTNNMYFLTDNTERMRLTNDGILVVGAGHLGTPSTGRIVAAYAGGTDVNGADLTFDGGWGTGTGAGGPITFRTSPAGGSTGTSLNASVERMRITSDGNVLVNTTEQFGSNTTKIAVFSSGQDQLSVIDTTAQAANVGGAISLGGNYRAAGDAQPFVRIRANKSNSTDNNFDYGMAFDTTPDGGSFTQRMYISGAGNVGIGASSPNAPLDISKTQTLGYSATNDQRNSARLIVRNSDETAEDFSSISFVTGGSFQAEWSINSIYKSAYEGDLAFKTRIGGSSWSERMRITNAGNVEITAVSDVAGGGTNPVYLRITDLGQDGGGNTWNIDQDFTQLQFYSSDASAPTLAGVRWSIGTAMQDSAGTETDLIFRKWSAGTSNNGSLRLSYDGSMTIGAGHLTATPGHAIVTAPYGAGTDIGGGDFYIYGGRSTGTAVGGDIVLYTSPAGGSTGTSVNAHLERMRINNAGYVSITNNTATAYTNVAPNISDFGLVIGNNQNHVSGGIFSGLQFNQTGDSQNRITYIGAITEDVNQNSALVFGTDSGGLGRTEKMRIDSSGNVLIGDTSLPASPTPSSDGVFLYSGGSVRVVDSATNGSSSFYGLATSTDVNAALSSGHSLNLFNLDSTDGNVGGHLRFGKADSLSTSYVGGVNISHTNREGALIFGTSNGSAPLERVRIRKDGNVGINFNLPPFTTATGTYPTPESAIISPLMAAIDFVGTANMLSLVNTNNDGTADGISINFGLNRNENDVIRYTPAISFVKENQWTGTPTTVKAGLRFSVQNQESVQEAMRIDSLSRVGVGTAANPNNTRMVIKTVETTGDGVALHLMHGDGTLSTNQQVSLTFGNTVDGNTSLASIAAAYGGSNYDGDLVFKTNTGAAGNLTERMRIDSGGDVSITSGNLILSNGAGIDFSATPNTGNMTSELLDDYEEGVFTANFSTDTGSITLNTSYDTLSYTKIGNQVTIRGRVRLASVSSPTGGLNMNLPFTTVNTVEEDGMACGDVYVVNSSRNAGDYGCVVFPNASVLSIYHMTGTTYGAMAADLSGDETIVITITYQAA